MGIAKNGYYTLEDIKKHNAQYNIIYSTRSDGKSFAVKDEGLSDSWNTGKASFGYVRRYRDDINTELVNKYFVERGVNLIEKITRKRCNCIDYYRGYLYFAKDKPNEKIDRVLRCGEVFALSVAQKRYKSTGHPDINLLDFEEVFTNEGYLKNEPELLQQLVSTCARNDDIKVYLLANTVSRICPYVTDWGLRNFKKQKMGTIDDYFIETDELDENGKPKKIKIAVERSAPSTHKSNMFFGNVAKSIQGGSWETHNFAKLPDDYKNFEIIYELTYRSISDFVFTVQLLLHTADNYLIVYVYPAKALKDRIICGAFSTDIFSTPTLDKNNKAEILIHNLIVDNKICFSDNLTGEDFNASLKAETKYPF